MQWPHSGARTPDQTVIAWWRSQGPGEDVSPLAIYPINTLQMRDGDGWRVALIQTTTTAYGIEVF